MDVVSIPEIETPDLVGTDAAIGRLSEGRTLWMTLLLTAIALLATLDRNAFSLLLVPMKHDLKVSDAAMGALSGTAFAIVYATSALPLARLADKVNRRNLVMAAVAVWSAGTALCGLAGNYVQLLLAQVAVATGEAANGPANNSLLADLYPPVKRGMALSILAVGISIGFVVGPYITGLLVERLGWHGALVALASPGLLLILLLWLTGREPPRGGHDGGQIVEPDAATFWLSLRRIFRTRTSVLLLAGMMLTGTAISSWVGWLPAFFMRVDHFSPSKMGLAIGAVIGVAGIISSITSGVASDWFSRRGTRWRMYYCCIMIAVAIPPQIAALMVHSPALTLGLIFIHTVCAGGLSQVVVTAMMLSMAPPSMRALTTAVFGLATSIVAGSGPLLVGLLNDALKAGYGDQALRYSLLIAPVCWVAAIVVFFLCGRAVEQDLEGTSVGGKA